MLLEAVNNSYSDPKFGKYFILASGGKHMARYAYLIDMRSGEVHELFIDTIEDGAVLDYLINVFTSMGFKSRLYNRDKYTNNLHFTLNKKNIKIIYNFFYQNSNYFLLRKKISFEIGLNNTEVSS